MTYINPSRMIVQQWMHWHIRTYDNWGVDKTRYSFETSSWYKSEPHTFKGHDKKKVKTRVDS